jgi:hypothetical protein
MRGNSRGVAMHLLYLDDSGSVDNPTDRHIVLAGVSVFERQPHWLSQELDRIAADIWPDNPYGLEFRGADIRGGKKHWRGVPRDTREAAYRNAMTVLARSSHVRLFAVAVHKAAASPDDAMELAFEHVSNRFDRMLGRLHVNNDTQRGLIILDESSYETSLQRLARDFRANGHRWGKLYNLCDVPLFVDSRATRMIQYADMVAHAVRRYYENGDAMLFEIVAPKFDAVGGVTHGLVHVKPPDMECVCACCRRK